MLMKIFPAFFAFISLSLPGGLVLYFFVSNLYRVGQQALISHTIYKPAREAGIISTTATEAEPPDPDEPPKGFLERMLGDAAPRLGDRKGNAAPAKSTKSTSGPAKNGNRSGPGSNSRTTPSGKKPQSSGARRKKRKR
jgi:membrane protein insertase Oxa1/YidC/SpoIIIJ